MYLQLSHDMASPRNLRSTSDASKLNLAIQALDNDASLLIRRAAAIYNVSRKTLGRRQSGVASKRDIPAQTRKLTDSEEKVIASQILKQVSEGKPPRISIVQAVADQLRKVRDASLVGEKWTYNFIKRYPGLKKTLNCRCDKQRAQCEDPNIIRKWFDQIRVTIKENGIQPNDI